MTHKKIDALFLLGLLILTSLIVIIPACTQKQMVRVVDTSGNPVRDAEVCGVSLSINTQKERTDANGWARVPSGVQEKKWVQVSKTGYQTATVEVPAIWPLTVTLQPTK